MADLRIAGVTKSFGAGPPAVERIDLRFADGELTALPYPALSRLDPAMMEAARTMGARPFTVIRTVAPPACRRPIAGAALMLFVHLLGACVTVTVFADPSRQTLTITLCESVRGATFNAPFGAAQAMVLPVNAVACLGASLALAKRAERRSWPPCTRRCRSPPSPSGCNRWSGRIWTPPPPRARPSGRSSAPSSWRRRSPAPPRASSSRWR
ncbi:MAG: hypothetical protein CML46_09835 [Rhodobacteraceae bacterium]|nr:hypothetical protein [Paracoccaceae bacterium]MBR27226.1 hypothetical protein [Paracoccaceae bacterium]